MTSNIPEFNVVCEGPTDHGVIEAVLAAILEGADFVLQRIQPLESLYGGDAGPHGGGWKGVRSWCCKTRTDWGSVGDAKVSIAGELLIIHVDTDVAHEDEINCATVCPPASTTVENLRAEILSWLGNATLPDWIVLCTPSKDTDAWVLTAIYPNDAWVVSDLECRLHPAERLCNKPERLVRVRNGQYKKNTHAYRGISNRLSNAWPMIKKRCSEANRFDGDFRKSLSILS